MSHSLAPRDAPCNVPTECSCSTPLPSREFRGIYLCTPNTRHPSGCPQCHHRVRFAALSLYCKFPYLLTLSAILASVLLHEELGHLGRLGCSLCLLGSLIIVLHAPPDKEITTVDEVLDFARQPGACRFVELDWEHSRMVVLGQAVVQYRARRGFASKPHYLFYVALVTDLVSKFVPKATPKNTHIVNVSSFLLAHSAGVISVP